MTRGEPVALHLAHALGDRRLVKSGDIEFAIISSANTATISPQAGVMSLYFLFRNEAHVVTALADPQVFEEIKTMIDETTQASM